MKINPPQLNDGIAWPQAQSQRGTGASLPAALILSHASGVSSVAVAPASLIQERRQPVDRIGADDWRTGHRHGSASQVQPVRLVGPQTSLQSQRIRSHLAVQWVQINDKAVHHDGRGLLQQGPGSIWGWRQRRIIRTKGCSRQGQCKTVVYQVQPAAGPQLRQPERQRMARVQPVHRRDDPGGEAHLFGLRGAVDKAVDEIRQISQRDANRLPQHIVADVMGWRVEHQRVIAAHGPAQAKRYALPFCPRIALPVKKSGPGSGLGTSPAGSALCKASP